MNKSSCRLDYHNKEFDYIRAPVLQRIYSTISAGLIEAFFRTNGFWLCMAPMLNYKAEVFVDAAEPWQTAEATVFQTEYASLYVVTWLPEFYVRCRLWYMLSGVRKVLEGCGTVLAAVLGNDFNVRDLYALMTV